MLVDYLRQLPYLLFGLKGRINRRRFWLAWLVYLILVPAVWALLEHIAPDRSRYALIVLVIWSSVAISAKRLHDIGKPGYWACLNFLPIVGLLFAAFVGAATFWWAWFNYTSYFVAFTFVVEGLWPGTKEPNRFGESG